MKEQTIKNKFLRAGFALLLALPFGLHAQERISVPIRALTTPCEYMIVAKSNTKMGVPVTDSLNIQDLDAWLATNPQINTDTHALYAVGAPMRKKDRVALMDKVKASLAEAGYGDLDVESIRQFTGFIEKQSGLFSVQEDGSYERLARLDYDEMRAAVAGAVPEKLRNLVLIGAPVFGGEKRNFENIVKAALEAREDANTFQTDIRSEFKPLTFIKEFIKRPGQALLHLGQRIRWFLPMKEDWQTPTGNEINAAFDKILIPSVATFYFLSHSGGEPMKVWLPVMLMNGVNSFSTGAFRTFIGNWFSRTQTLFPGKFIKQFMFSALFTANIYWAGSGSVHNMMQIFTLGAWMHLCQSSWLSNLFQSSWRIPLQEMNFGWERIRVAQGQKDETVRSKGAAIDKYMSYLMTQFYIYSIASHSVIGKIVSGATNWWNAGAYNLGAGETLLMKVNAGHVAMASVGTLAGLGLAYTKFIEWRQRRNASEDGTAVVDGMGWMDKLGAFAGKINEWEDKFHNLYKKPVVAVVDWVKETFFRPSSKDGVEDDPNS